MFLNREYTVAEYLTTMTDPKLRKSLFMYRLSIACPQNEVETELHFLTSCQMYDHIRDTYFPQITQTHKEFENKSNFGELPYILCEIPHCAITAARFMICCHKKRATSEKQPPL